MNQERNRDKIGERIQRQGVRPAESGLLGSSSIRFLLGWVLSIGVLAMAVNLPIYPQKARIGWNNVPPAKHIVLLPMPPEEKEIDKVDGSPVTVFIQPEKIDEPLPELDKKGDEEDTAPIDPVMQPQKLQRIDRGPILEFVDENPAIIGGLSTLYLSIDYPKIARDQGIEGLTVLIFVVEKDGSTHDITVLKPLHPALDSAAVAAVRKTLFKPGRQDGKIVRVKMRLPIRFRLVNRSKPTLADTLATNSDR